MDIKIVKQEKEDLEIELDDNALPTVLANNLMQRDIDAVFYNPHPLIPGSRLRVKTKKPLKELKTSIEEVEETISEFKEQAKEEIE